jgi:cytochrome c
MSMKLPINFLVLIVIAVISEARADGGGDPVMGKRQFAQCGACHTIDKGGPNKVGPNLNGIFGRKAASIAGFEYSDAMRKSEVIWDERSLDAFIKQPSAFISGTAMTFLGVPKDQARADLIAYLKEMGK